LNCTRKFEDIKGVIRSLKSTKESQYNGRMNRTKRQTMGSKLPHRQLKIEQRELKSRCELRCSGRV